MDDRINKHLHDILYAINEVESFFGDKPKYFEEFCDDLCLRRAVERDIEIIGLRHTPDNRQQIADRLPVKVSQWTG